MRIGYCSPFNPMKSGVSDFSEELVAALKEYVEVVIFSPVELERKDISEAFETHMLSDLHDESLRNSLDVIVYHLGNNIKYHGEIVDMLLQYPGIAEIHDFGMHHLAAEKYYLGKGPEAYLEEVIYCHGEYGGEIARRFLAGLERAPWETHTLDLCMNKRYIDAATAVVVHSEAAKQMTLGIRPDIPVTKIMLHTEMEADVEAWKKECRDKLQIPESVSVAGSFGFATTAKRILPILDALERLKETDSREFIYYIVGEPQKELDLENAIARRGLQDHVRVTGFTSLEDFKLYMGACDFCLNLRYPTQGESSASLHRMLGMGKPAVVTDVGTFSDYPDDIVLKVRYDEHEVDDILTAMRTLTDDRKEFRKRSKKAVDFARENCDPLKNAERYHDFFQQVIQGSWRPDIEDVMVGRLCELGLTDEAYLRHICPAWQEFGL